MYKRAGMIAGVLLLICGAGHILPAQPVVALPPEMEMVRDSFRAQLYVQPAYALALARRYDSLAKQAGNRSEMARARNFLGMAFFRQGLIDEAITHYVEALTQYQALNDSLYTGIVYNNIGAAYQERRKPEETILYFQRALDIFTAIGDSVWMGNVLLNLTYQYVDSERYHKAIPLAEQALAFFTARRDTVKMLAAHITYAGIPFKLEQFKEADKWYQKALELNKVVGSAEDSVVLFSNTGYTRAKLGHFAEGEQMLQAALAIAKRIGSVDRQEKIYQFLVILYEENQLFEQAYWAQKQYMAITDSLFSSEKDGRMLEMLQKYEAQQKEQQIQLLNTENQLRRRQQLFALAGLALALALAATLVFLYYQKQRSNQLLAEKNVIISRALTEKEALLAEIHHRVKNNLQIVSSLLNLQARHVQDEGALRALQEGRSRVSAMSLIHQHLYLEEHPTAIHLPTYVSQLAEKLFGAYNLNADRVRLELDIEDLLLDVDTAIPLGLILNELITNAVKYAFGEAEHGRLEIGLHQAEDHLSMRVADNGPGFPAGFDWRTSNSFGFRLLQAFSQKLKGEIVTGSGPGAWVELRIHSYQLG